MKPIYIAFLMLFVACSSVESENIPVPFPDFSSCNCSVEYNPICGNDGRNYLNECLLSCMGIDSTSHENCPDVFFNAQDTLTWPIERVCIPVPNPQLPQFIRLLSDGSAIYQRPDSTYFRGNQNLCRCLSSNTLISTPNGPIPVSQLEIGDKVWTLNEEGLRISAPIKNLHSVSVGNDHIMLNIHLEDERFLRVSSMHPNSLGIPLSHLSEGDSLDGSSITKLYYSHYRDTLTWDLLPIGSSGVYWANDILIGSTMKDWNGNLTF